MPPGHAAEYSRGVRVALVSPYSWTYPGGVTRHIEALAGQLIAQGHDARILTPVDRDTRLVRWLHGGARPAPRPLPDHVVPLGGTAGLPANGAVSNLALTPSSVARLRHELRAGGYDVVHVHSPEAPAVSWDAVAASQVPLVATFHAHSTSRISPLVLNLCGSTRRFNQIGVRIAVSEAAAWTSRRWHRGEYRIIPNGVHLPPPAAEAGDRTDDYSFEIVFVGQAVERKGLPVLLRAFEALREHVPARLTLVGPDPEEVAPLLLDDRGIEALGKADDAAKARVLARAHVLCAPSLGGESFGMVLTEAFAHGTAVVASRIAGYNDVVRDGVDGLLVPRGDAAAVAAALRDLALDPARRAAMGAAARERAQRFAWPRVTAEIVEAYEDAMALPAPATALGRLAVRSGLRPADGARLPPPRREPRPEPGPERSPAPGALLRRAALVLVALAALGGAAVAVDRIGAQAILNSLLSATPVWVVAALGVMCASMVLRGIAWHAILTAALPHSRVRRADALQGTFIGVLMSATLPARLGEPSRAFVVARRVGRIREHLPVVAGTIVSQALLNILALVVLGLTMLSTVDLFRSNRPLVAIAIAPLAVLLCVLVAPALLRAGGAARARRAMLRVRDGLRVFRRPRLGAAATVAQMSAWALQALSCWLLLVALGLDDSAGFAGAAAVLFAVNVTAVLPAVPSNLGVFQAACVVVLAAYGVGHADALAFGIILQAVEIATAVIMGAPALVKEGLSWREIRLRALHATPVTLAPISGESRAASG
jgi:phosphatidyl-myo-inositol alpha-mannosyltransferase